MSELPAAVHALVDVELGGVLLANMLADWLDGDGESSASVEVADEYYDQRATAEQNRLCVCASVDAGTGPSPSGEHRTPVCAEGESPGFGQVRSADSGSGGFQDSGSGSFDGAGGCGFCPGGFATGALEFRLASIAGVVCANRHAGDRRRWLLQPGRFQRRTSVGLEGDDGSGRTSFIARAPPWWQAQ